MKQIKKYYIVDFVNYSRNKARQIIKLTSLPS